MNAVRDAYYGSDGTATRRILRRLDERGVYGRIAAALFRAQKVSSRAKRYGRAHRGSLNYRDAAYTRKDESIQSLCTLLLEGGHGLTWGWEYDPTQEMPVLYVDLPGGQVSFHAMRRHGGPDYPGQWDGQHASEERIVDFASDVLFCRRRIGMSFLDCLRAAAELRKREMAAAREAEEQRREGIRNHQRDVYANPHLLVELARSGGQKPGNYRHLRRLLSDEDMVEIHRLRPDWFGGESFGTFMAHWRRTARRCGRG